MNCPKSSPRPKPNLKNKDFVKWQRAEKIICRDNIISTDWHEKLEKTPLFTTVDNGNPTNMIYIMSGEYGRMWLKERDEWYANVFIPSFKEMNFINRRKKIRREAKKAKKEAEANIKERKERRAKELEAKAKAEQEKAEKLRAKIQKNKTTEKKKIKKDVKDVKDSKGAKTTKTSKTSKANAAKSVKNEESSSPSTTAKEEEEKEKEGKIVCPKNYLPIELTVQCECSHHVKQEHDNENQNQDNNNNNNSNNNNNNNNNSPSDKIDNTPTLCKNYISQLAEIQEEKNSEINR